ncbi:leucine-rich repeat domain-containing protein [Roseomonas sp. F4]
MARARKSAESSGKAKSDYRAFAAALAAAIDTGRMARSGVPSTHQRLASILGVDPRSVRNWRNAISLPSRDNLEGLMTVLLDSAGQRPGNLETLWQQAQRPIDVRPPSQTIDFAEQRENISPAGLDASVSATLAATPPEPDGAIFEEGEGRLVLQQGQSDDHAVASQPNMAKRHLIIIEKLQDLKEAIDERLDNQRSWRALPNKVQKLHDALENQPTYTIPDQLVELYDRTMSLASFVELDDMLSRSPDAIDDPLAPDIRRALVDALSTLAPWLRTFPSVVRWDSARRDALTRPELFVAVRAQLEDAHTLIHLAGAADALSQEDVARASEPLETAQGQGFQAEKAGYRGLSTARNLLTRTVAIKALALTTAFYTGAIGSDFSTKSKLVQAASTFLARGEEQALRLAMHMPADVAAAIRHVLTRSQSKDDEDRARQQTPVTQSGDRQDPPANFNPEAVRLMILAGQRPPAEWVPFIDSLQLRATSISDLSPLSGLISLERLDISDTGVTDLAPLVGLSSLRMLNLDGTDVTDLSPLSELTSLTQLGLDSTKVTDLTPLKSIESLTIRKDGATFHVIRGQLAVNRLGDGGFRNWEEQNRPR